MGTTTISPRRFRAEAERRLIDIHGVMNLLGLRTRQGVRDRVKRGQLPPPLFTAPNALTLWDRDEITTTTRQKG